MALLDRRPRGASVIARTLVRAARIDAQGFLQLVRLTPAFSLHVMRVTAAHLRALDDMLR
jgi:CRP-like cAMP-binding protein